MPAGPVAYAGPKPEPLPVFRPQRVLAAPDFDIANELAQLEGELDGPPMAALVTTGTRAKRQSKVRHYRPNRAAQRAAKNRRGRFG